MTGKIYDSFDLETIEALADIVKSRELEEITIADGEKKITVKGRKTPPPPPRPPMDMPAAPFAFPAVNMPVPMSAAQPPQSVPDKGIADGNVVKAPIVGTFYSAPAPGKPPFVSVGQKVRKGDVLMIIESMKLMNEIQSEFDGTVTEIIVKDGQTVEFDQPIMVIK